MLGCLTWDGLDRYPDERRQRAEWGMALLSLGAAVENLMLAAADRALASCWVAAPIFCPEEARDALALPGEWLPHAMVVVGVPDPAYAGRLRPPIPLDDLRGSGNYFALRAPLKCSRVRATPSSIDVHGFQPRWIAARRVQRAALDLTGARGP